MTSNQTSADSADIIFSEAVQRGAGPERSRYLDAACAGNPEKRRQVERLLRAYAEADSFLESPASDPLSTPIDGQIERPGDVIGPFTLVEQIGEGGFGVVFLAEQERPVRRKVALKVIKPGMDTRAVIGRFEAERQALALMDHPHIAKVFDAGSTESGRPCFVMELVQGVPITEYCDQCGLTTRERLELFVLVCQAVQHAHQKGVIHRDLKPTNILVAMQDGQAAPKIIDFGVAKAMNQRLTEQTLATGFFQMIGTPTYMSPEQAELSPLGVDTRSDVYSLGVLLYELLTGMTPFDKARLHSAGYDELRRIIREEEPPRPSMRLSTLAAETATTLAEAHRTDPRRLTQALRGDLDWIVMKCLEKDRNRRYETVSGLANDVECYLADEPVDACPPSTMYRFKKFARRNKFGLQAAAVVAVALVVGSVVSTWQAVRANRAQRETERARNQAHQAINDYFTLVSEDDALRHEPTLEPLRRRLLERALSYYEQFARQDRQSPQWRAEMAVACARIAILSRELDTGGDWLDWLNKSAVVTDELLEAGYDLSQYPSLAAGQRWLANADLVRFPDREKAIQTLTRFGRVREVLAQRYPSAAGFQNDLAAYYLGMAGVCSQTDKKRALDFGEEACRIYETLVGKYPRISEYRAALARSLTCTACTLLRLRKPAAEKKFERARDLVLALKNESSNLPVYRAALGSTYEELGFAREHYGDFKGAEQAYRDMIRCYDDLWNDYPSVLRYHQAVFRGRLWLGELLWGTGAEKEGKDQLKQALAIGEQIAPRDPFARYLLAWLLADAADPEIREQHRALIMAESLVEHGGEFGECWNTLGIARYRSEDYEGAVDAFDTGAPLAKVYDSCTAKFFLAMALYKSNKPEEAIECYQEGVAQMNEEYDMLEYHRVRKEAAAVLGLPPPNGKQLRSPVE